MNEIFNEILILIQIRINILDAIKRCQTINLPKSLEFVRVQTVNPGKNLPNDNYFVSLSKCYSISLKVTQSTISKTQL